MNKKLTTVLRFLQHICGPLIQLLEMSHPADQHQVLLLLGLFEVLVLHPLGESSAIRALAHWLILADGAQIGAPRGNHWSPIVVKLRRGAPYSVVGGLLDRREHRRLLKGLPLRDNLVECLQLDV